MMAFQQSPGLLRSAIPLIWALVQASDPVLAGPTGETLLTERATCGLWLLYPIEKILKKVEPSVEQRTDRIRISAARGEFESFVLLLRPTGRRPLMDVRFRFDGLGAGPDGGSFGVEINYWRVGYVYVDMPSGASVFADVGERHLGEAVPFGSSKRTGYFPDRLLPDPVAVAPPGENTQFWFTLYVPPDARPGRREGNVVLAFRGSDEVVIPLAVTVYDFVLPRRGSLRNTTCWSPQYFERPLDTDFLKSVYRDLARYRQAPDPILPQPGLEIRPDGSTRIDTEKYDEMATYCLDELGVSHLFFPRVGGAWYTNVYHLWHHPAVRKQKWYGVRIFDDDLGLTPEFRRTFGDYVGKMTAYFRAKGWLGRVYMTTMDEPHTAEDLLAVRNFGRFVKAVAPEIKLFCTTYPRAELLNIIDAWCPQRYDRAAWEKERAEGKEFMFYKNWFQLTDMPMVNPRLYGWLAMKTGAAGWLTYATMGRWNRAWDEPYVLYPNLGTKAWGLGLWWYPGLLERRILKSARWEIMREGAEDVEYFHLLRDRLQALSETRKQSDEARAARAFLDTATDRVVLYPDVLPAGREDGWLDRAACVTAHRPVWQLRNEAARRIEELSDKR